MVSGSLHVYSLFIGLQLVSIHSPGYTSATTNDVRIPREWRLCTPLTASGLRKGHCCSDSRMWGRVYRVGMGSHLIDVTTVTFKIAIILFCEYIANFQ